MAGSIIYNYNGYLIDVKVTRNDRIMKWSAKYHIDKDGTIHRGEIGFFDSKDAAEDEGKREGKEYIDNLPEQP